MSPPKADRYIDKVIELDRKCVESGNPLGSYHMGIYRKSPHGPIPARQWSIEELSRRAMPPAPLRYRMMRGFKKTWVGRILRSIKPRMV